MSVSGRLLLSNSAGAGWVPAFIPGFPNKRHLCSIFACVAVGCCCLDLMWANIGMKNPFLSITVSKNRRMNFDVLITSRTLWSINVPNFIDTRLWAPLWVAVSVSSTNLVFESSTCTEIPAATSPTRSSSLIWGATKAVWVFVSCSPRANWSSKRERMRQVPSHPLSLRAHVLEHSFALAQFVVHSTHFGGNSRGGVLALLLRGRLWPAGI